MKQKKQFHHQRALEINPDYTEALNNMGNAFKDLGETEKAIEFYEKALDIDPNYAQAYYNMGNAFKNLGLPEKAISSYKKVLFLSLITLMLTITWVMRLKI